MENTNKIKAFDENGNEIELNLDILKSLIKQQIPGYTIVANEQLKSIIEKTTDLQTMVTSSVEVIVMFTDLFGGKIPTGMVEAISAVPKVIRKLNENTHLVENLQQKIKTIQTLAPKYLHEDLIKKIGSTAQKTIDNAN